MLKSDNNTLIKYNEEKNRIKKILSKEQKVNSRNENKKPIKISDVKIDEKFKNLCNYVNENLLKTLNLNKEAFIKNIEVGENCIIIIDVNGRKKTKNPVKFIEEFFNKELTQYRKNLTYGWFRLKDYKFEITNKVKYYYLEDNYDINSKYSIGTLSSNCMRYYDTNKYMQFYEGEDIKLVILKNKKTGKIIGRALLWDTTYDENHREFEFIDRIYGDDITIAMFRRWAYQNGYACKKYQNCSEKKDFLVDGKTINETIYYKLKNDIDVYENCGIPYMDTMTYYNSNGYLSNNAHNADFSLDSMNGNKHIFETYVECSVCGCRIPESAAEWRDEEPYCYECWEETIGWCEICGRRFTRDDIINKRALKFEGSYYCDFCFKNSVIYCKEEKSYYHKESVLNKNNEKNEQILNRVNKLIKKHKNESTFRDGLWEIKILPNNNILAVYNSKEKYYIEAKEYMQR